jgi:hypothetical protein
LIRQKKHTDRWKSEEGEDVEGAVDTATDQAHLSSIPNSTSKTALARRSKMAEPEDLHDLVAEALLWSE